MPHVLDDSRVQTNQDRPLREVVTERPPITRSRPRWSEGATVAELDPVGDIPDLFENWI